MSELPKSTDIPHHKYNHAADARDEIMARLGYDDEVFERTGSGNLRKGDRVTKRIEIWKAMRAADLSYPAIAWACGMTTHSTIIESVNDSRTKEKHGIATHRNGTVTADRD